MLNSVLDIFHSDVWGPAFLTAVLGFNYYVIFVNDCTRFTWLFSLKHKLEILSIFKHCRHHISYPLRLGLPFPNDDEILRPKETLDQHMQARICIRRSDAYVLKHGLVHITKVLETYERQVFCIKD